MDNSDKILNELQTLGLNKTPKIDLDNVVIESKTDQAHEVSEESRTVCRLLKLHLSDFFDNIYIPFKFFKKQGWNIGKVLSDNEDSLFCNEEYLPEKDLDKFYEVFYKYIQMIEDIMTPDNLLMKYLKKWTDMSRKLWKENKNKSYIKSILSKTKYQLISPLYVIELFCEITEKHKTNVEKIKSELEERLNELVKEAKSIVKEFRKIYEEIINLYVYEYPVNEIDKISYNKSFVNSILTTILYYVDRLIDIHIYAIHPIFINITEEYLPLDEINSYDPSSHSNKKLLIV